MNIRPLLAATLALLASAALQAQTKSTAEGIAEYRKMLEDGNPAELFEAKGENLWKTPRGPKNASLQQCNLGLGPGVVKGAWVQLPRFFADTGRVQDLESRLLSCMETLQGFNAAEIAKTGFDKGEQATLAALAAYVSAESRGLKMALPQGHAEERRFYELGQTASASACRTCPTSPRTPAMASALRRGRPTGCPAARCGACSAA